MSVQTSVYYMISFALNYQRAAVLGIFHYIIWFMSKSNFHFSLDLPYLAHLCGALAQISLYVLVCCPDKLTSCLSVGFVLCLSLALDLS